MSANMMGVKVIIITNLSSLQFAGECAETLRAIEEASEGRDIGREEGPPITELDLHIVISEDLK